ncbi:MAG TPA: hypothetical protein VLA87_03830 [Gaiellaceae bacterium]|nr:hypothetical protein [Gaiellaceae bacterium]
MAALADRDGSTAESEARPEAFVRVLRSRLFEEALVVTIALLATLHAEWRIVSQALTFQTDSMIHEFWMRRFRDDGLFGDPLTESLLETGYSPPAFRALYWLASRVVDPVTFGELLPLVLQPLAVWLVFRIVRTQVSWRPAAWISGALFLVPWEIHRFSGGHPRAFAQPIVLLTVLLLLSRRNRAAALVPPVGLLLYPPAGVVALAVVLLSTLARDRRAYVDVERARWAAVSVLGVVAAFVLTRFTTGSQDVITEAEARLYPEFGPGGQMHFFASSTLEYLRQNYSGFFLQESGSIIAVTALLLLLVRPSNTRLLRWEVWTIPIVALALFLLAHALLFRLYLPHRYTYALLPFFCIAIGVFLRPTLQALSARGRAALVVAPLLGPAAAFLALAFFPLGPRFSVAEFGSWLADAAPELVVGLLAGLLLAVALWPREPGGARSFAAAALAVPAALVTAAVLVATVAVAGGGRSPGAVACQEAELYSFLETVPKESVLAADPLDANCIPIAARRPVVISRKLYQPWAVEYFDVIRERMSASVEAFYGPSLSAVTELRERYGADYLVVRTRGQAHAWGSMQPFTSEVSRLRRTTEVPAVERLPRRCLSWSGERYEVYSLACLAGEESA